ncbi:MAG: GGDEF domain-containing protein [Microthrixaceae bacterium]
MGSRDRSELGEAAAALAAAAQEGGPLRWSGEVNVTGADGSVLAASVEVLAHQGEDGRLGFVSTVARDMSERVELHRRLEREATHDHLTGLPNRAMLFERIHDASSAVGSDPDHHVALLFIDLDHFKSINDSLGHHVGDQLLSAISRRVRTAVRPGDVVGRFGGDEFVVLCEGVESIDAATTVVPPWSRHCRRGCKVDGHDDARGCLDQDRLRQRGGRRGSAAA